MKQRETDILNWYKTASNMEKLIFYRAAHKLADKYEQLEALNAELVEALEEIVAMRTWVGKWRIDEFTSTSHVRLHQCFIIADNILAKARGDAQGNGG